MSARVAPIHLGCCPEASRCLLCNPAPKSPSPDFVEALSENYDTPETPSVPFFIGGAPPRDDQLKACGPRSIRVRVRPDLLTRSRASELVGWGVVRVELDALTFSDDALRQCGRVYTRSRLETMAEGLRALGLEVGLVLAPGLPHSSHATAVEDARLATQWADVVRLHPVLVLSQAGLREAHMDRRYEPLTLGEAITTCRAMMDVLEAGGVEVIRVGVQGAHDGVGRVVAGPVHGSLRDLVEARRTLDVLRARLADVAPGSYATLRCARCDEGRVRGYGNQHLRTLRSEFSLRQVDVVGEATWPRGTVEVEVLHAGK